MDSLARCYESEYNLWPGTLHSFALQESAYDTDAFRVETGYVNQGGAYSKEVARQAELFCLDTNHKFYLPIALEREQRGSSFGLFQDMGQIFRELGYDKMYIQPSTKEQFYYFAVDATRRLKSAGRPRTLRRLASSWNTGNPNKAQYGSYANNIAKYQKKFAY